MGAWRDDGSMEGRWEHGGMMGAWRDDGSMEG